MNDDVRLLVGKTAKVVAKSFPEVEEDDLAQDLYLFLAEKPHLASHEYLATILGHYAYQKAWDYRKQGMYLSAQYSYRTDDVKEILKRMFSMDTFAPDYWTAPMDLDKSRTTLEDRVAVHSDVAAAFDRLPIGMKRKLFNRFALGLIPEGATEYRKLNEAVEKLTDILNYYRGSGQGYHTHESVGSRRVITNGQAIATIQDLDG